MSTKVPQTELNGNESVIRQGGRLIEANKHRSRGNSCTATPKCHHAKMRGRTRQSGAITKFQFNLTLQQSSAYNKRTRNVTDSRRGFLINLNLFVACHLLSSTCSCCTRRPREILQHLYYVHRAQMLRNKCHMLTQRYGAAVNQISP